MNNYEKLDFEILRPNGFIISAVQYDKENFTPYREITHPLHKGKVWKYTPEYSQDIHIFGVGTIDQFSTIKEKLTEVFGDIIKEFDGKYTINHYSYCSIRSNSVTEEQICVGLFFETNDKVIFKVSPRKMSLARIVYPEGYKLAESYINQTLKSIDSMTLSMLENESRQQNGVIAISSPKIYKGNSLKDLHLLFKNVENEKSGRN